MYLLHVTALLYLKMLCYLGISKYGIHRLYLHCILFYFIYITYTKVYFFNSWWKLFGIYSNKYSLITTNAQNVKILKIMRNILCSYKRMRYIRIFLLSPQHQIFYTKNVFGVFINFLYFSSCKRLQIQNF